MDASLITIALISLVAVLVLMMFGIPLPWAIGASAIIGALAGWGWPGVSKVGLIVYSQFFNLQWTPLPLFTFMSCVINETRMCDDLFDAANKWTSRIPGGLVVSSILAEAGMGAPIGSSSTTALAVGKVAIPQMERLGYNKAFAAGAILTAGVLGPLIPPGLDMVTYGVIARVSIGQLFIAGIIPGILLTVMLVAYTILACAINPRLGSGTSSVSWKERIISLKTVWPIVVILISVLGGIYFGIVTATEAGGVACVVTLIIAVVFYRFRWRNLINSIKETTILSGMIFMMLITVMMFTYVVATSGLAQKFATLLVNSGLSRWVIIVAINLLLLFLGCFVDALTILLLTLPFFVPLVTSLGFDLVWFGVLMLVNIEIGLITPPMGLNLFIIRQAFNLPIGKLIKATAPFLAVLILFLGILIAFPQISIWLVGKMMGS